MQVRPGRPPRARRRRRRLRCVPLRSPRARRSRQVREERLKPCPVIEDDRVAGEVEIGGEHHAPRVGRRDWCAVGAGEVRRHRSGARGSLLKTLRTPNPETTALSIGTMNGPRHSGAGVNVRNTRPSSARLRAMRASGALGGVTKRRSTRSVRLETPSPRPSTSRCARSQVPRRPFRAVMATGTSPAVTVGIDPDPSARHTPSSPRNGCTARPKAVIDTVLNGSAATGGGDRDASTSPGCTARACITRSRADRIEWRRCRASARRDQDGIGRATARSVAAATPA